MGRKLLSTKPYPWYLIYATGIVLAIVLAGCPTEMAEQPSYKSQEAPLLIPPASSVPTQGRVKVIKDLASSIATPLESIKEGGYLYEIYCAMCHGEKGRGDGTVGKKFIPRPADLSSIRVRQLSDDDIFLRITKGFQTMPPFEKDLAPEERWHILDFIRTFGADGG